MLGQAVCAEWHLGTKIRGRRNTGPASVNRRALGFTASTAWREPPAVAGLRFLIDRRLHVGTAAFSGSALLQRAVLRAARLSGVGSPRDAKGNFLTSALPPAVTTSVSGRAKKCSLMMLLMRAPRPA